jgi:hypothetical protein
MTEFLTAFSPMLNTLWQAAGLFITALGFILGIGLFYAYMKGMWFFKKYLIPATVFEQRGLGFKTVRDKVRLEMVDGKEFYEFKSDKSRTPALMFKDITMGDEIIVFKTGRGEYLPAHPEFRSYTKTDEKGEIIKDKNGNNSIFNDMMFLPIIKPDAKIGFIDQYIANERRFSLSSFLSKYGVVIGFFVTIIVCGAMIYMTLDRLGPLIQSLNGMTGGITRSAELLANHTCYIPPIPGG